MADLITRTAKLVPYAKRPKQVPSFVTAYAYEPLSDERAAAYGNFYVVIEVVAGGRQSEEVADLIIESFGQQYYNEENQAADPLSRFETATKIVNRELLEYINQGNAAWIGKLSAVIAVQHESELHISHTGSSEAYLYRGKSGTRITAHPSERSGGPAKTFGSIASGNLEDDDRLLIATPALFHQLPLKRLQEVVSTNSPTRAINELTDLLKDASTERVAALIIGLTTPEQAALQVRSDEPSEIQLGTPETTLEAARFAAVPIKDATIASTKLVGSTAKAGWNKTKPHLQHAGYAAAGTLRSSLSTTRRRRVTAIVMITLLAVGSVLASQSLDSAASAKLLTRYEAAYKTYEAAAISSDAVSAKSSLQQAQQDISGLSGRDKSRLNTRLKHATLSAGEPSTVEALIAQMSDLADRFDGLNRVEVSTIISLSSQKNANPTHMEVSGGHAYLIDKNNDSMIYVVNITTKSIKKSLADTSKLGAVVATTLSSDNLGMYLLTSEPSVWYYRFSDDSLTAQAVALNQWESGSAIASYVGNLYILSSDGIYKHVKTLSGFSPKIVYLSVAQSRTLADSKAMAIDGNVYTLKDKELTQYLAGVLKTTVVVPPGLSGSTILKLSADGNSIIAVSPSTKHVGTWSTASGLLFIRQYAFNGTKEVYDAAYDSALQTGYALVDGRLVSFKTE